MNREGLREKVVSASLAVAWGLGMVCTNHIAKVSLSKAVACLWNLHASGIGVYCSLTGGIPGGAHGKESACQCRRHEMGITWVPHFRVSLGGAEARQALDRVQDPKS